MNASQWIYRMEKREREWRKALTRHGPDSDITRLLFGMMMSYLNACSPERPKMEGHA